MNPENQFNEILNMITAARRKSVLAVNKELIGLYWGIGQYISKKNKNSKWGKGIVKNLSVFITTQIPDIKGFSTQNLWRMKQFFETYSENKKLSSLLRELSWTNNLMIFSKATSEKEREFYIHLAIKENYSSRELERQIDSGVFERIILSKDKLSAPLREIHPKSIFEFRDNYVLDFLSLSSSHSEKDLRKKIVLHLKEFILEFGKNFAFVGEEYRVSVGNKDFYVDLLFFHRDLQCLVAFDLKITDFKPEYLGKMEFYLEALDRDIKKEHETPSVGIILCKNKDSQIVEYALSRTISPAMVSKYQTKLIDKKLLERKLYDFFLLANNEDKLEKE
jgi:predicted nuclease of restriction endonuclease-like (RecB) superfamily